MPCAMMHLQCARLYDENADLSFYIGNLSPDCVDIRDFKDRNHLRIYSGKEREEKLLELADTLDISKPYEFGVVLHLYTDMCWDIGPMNDHKKSYIGDNWFLDYRQEIRYISKYMYKTLDWAPVLWKEIDKAPMELYSSIEYYPAEQIRKYIDHNVKTHPEPPAIPSEVFPNELVFKFCEETVKGFKKWMKKNDLTANSRG